MQSTGLKETWSGKARNKANLGMSFAGILSGKGETFAFIFLISLYTWSSLRIIVYLLGQSSRIEAFSWRVTAKKVVQMEVRNALTSLDPSIRPLSSDILTLVLGTFPLIALTKWGDFAGSVLSKGSTFSRPYLCFAVLVLLPIKFHFGNPWFPLSLE